MDHICEMPVNVHMEIHTDGMHTCKHTEVPIHIDMKTYTRTYAYTEPYRHTKTHIQTH